MVVIFSICYHLHNQAFFPFRWRIRFIGYPVSNNRDFRGKERGNQAATLLLLPWFVGWVRASDEVQIHHGKENFLSGMGWDIHHP